MWFFLILGFFAVVVILLHVIFPKKYHWPSTLKKYNKLPGPSGVPFFGNCFLFLVKHEEIFPLLAKLTNEYGSFWRVLLLGLPIIFSSDLDLNETILNQKTHIKKGVHYEFLVPWLGTGLLISNGKKWADHRKWLTPAFHFIILEQYVSIINKNANILCQILENYEENKPLEIKSLISHCALDIICETAMGTKVNAQQGGETEYVKSIIRMSQIFMERNLKPWLYKPSVFSLLPIGWEQRKLLKTLHTFTNQVIKERKLAFKETHSNGFNKTEINDVGERKKRSFLDILLEISQTQNLITDEEIREEVDTFMFEGHDTTSAALLWALYELGLNPDIQEKVYQEQCEIFQDNNKDPTYANLQEMKYLERVIKETLRLYPSVPFLSRELEKDVTIRGCEIPAGTQIIILVYQIHRNPEVFPDPEKFDPDRFLPERIQNRHPFSYIPFSAGPRNCIGQKFAMMEEKIIISHIIRKFKIVSLDKKEDVKMMGEIILRPKEELKFLLVKR